MWGCEVWVGVCMCAVSSVDVYGVCVLLCAFVR